MLVATEQNLDTPFLVSQISISTSARTHFLDYTGIRLLSRVKMER
jgi:hypothetical protein